MRSIGDIATTPFSISSRGTSSIKPADSNFSISADKAAQIKNARGQTVDQFATANTDGSYTVRGNLKDFGAGEVLLDQYWYTGLGGGFGPVGEQFIYDASWVRLRELSLSYQLPESVCKALHIPGASLGFTGRNLALWTNSPQLGVDPETNLTGVTNGRGLDYFNNPGTKSYIFSLSVKI